MRKEVGVVRRTPYLVGPLKGYLELLGMKRGAPDMGTPL
jgi:hypothetical protein